MFHMVLVILNDLDDCDPVMDAWEALGVGGITIVESSGLGRARKSGMRGDLPPMPTLSDFFRRPEHRHRTIFTVVDSDELVDKLIAATEQTLGNLESADSGVLFVLPVSQARGLHGGQKRAQERKQG
jgi:nitrogen regulatory protein PII